MNYGTNQRSGMILWAATCAHAVADDLVDQYVLALVGMQHADAEGMPDDSVRGKTWLQKIMYIASKSCGNERFDFVPHRYGMHSKALDDSLNRCSRDGLICVHRPDGNGAIHITDEGSKKLDAAKCDDDMLRHMQSAKSLLNGLDYREMIVYSYALFPEMAERSEIVENFKSWQLDAARSMYLKGAVSFALAARISGLGRDGFGDYLQRGGVEPCASRVQTNVVVITDTPKF